MTNIEHYGYKNLTVYDLNDIKMSWSVYYNSKHGSSFLLARGDIFSCSFADWARAEYRPLDTVYWKKK